MMELKRGLLCIGVLLTLLTVNCSRAAPTPTPSPTAVSTPTSAVSPTPIPTATATPAAQQIIYIVQEGDTLSGIAQKFDVTMEAIIAANNIADPDMLRVGEELVIPR